MKNKTKIITGVTIIGLLSSGLAASIAWFAPGTNSFSANITGKVVEEYFHCGSGASDDPFVITRPIHYYHLVEFFQRKTVLGTSRGDVTFGTDYLYFQVGKDLDGDGKLDVYNYDSSGTYLGTEGSPSYSKTLNMAYYSGDNALMPIGTNEVPFFGSFDGGANTNAATGITIDNLNIRCSEEVVVQGGGTSKTTRTTADAGVFGYVADSDGTTNTVIANAYINNLTIDISDAAGNAVTNGDVTSHVTAHDSVVYVGYIVGHLHTYTNKTASANASPIHDVYVNNAKIEGGAGAQCHFGYVGFADTIDGVPGSELDLGDLIDELEAAAAAAGGQGSNWGGSINIKALNNRIYNMMNVTTNNGLATDDPATHHPTASTSNTLSGVTTGKTVLSKLHKTTNSSADKNCGHRYYSDSYNSVSIGVYGSGYAANTKMNLNPTSNQILYSFEDSGTKTNNFSGSYSTELPGTILPLNVDTKANGFATSSDNTGYIIGGVAAKTGNYNYQSATAVRTASSPIKNIKHSLGGSDSDTYTASALEVITNKNIAYSSSGYGRIEDSYNSSNTHVSSTLSGKISTRNVASGSLKKYDSSRSSLGDVLSGSSFIHGLHFTGVTVDKSKYETLTTAYINEETYSSYQLPKNSVDFNLKTNGYINFFAGSYQNATIGADSFFSLYVITRSGSNLSTIQEISKIYKNNDASTKTEYPHVYLIKGTSTYTTGVSTISSSNVGDLEFDCQYLWEDPPVDGAVYYYEIPTNKGEYAIGNPSNGATAGCYLMYLDIGASGEETATGYNVEHKVRDNPIFTQMEYTSSGYVDNACFNIGYVIPEGSDKDKFSIKVTRSGTIFAVEIINTSGHAFEIDILLVDNNAIHTDDYPYTYTLKYNSGAVSGEYGYSGTWQGSSGGTALTLKTT